MNALRSTYILYRPRKEAYRNLDLEPQPAPNSEGKGVLIGVVLGAALWAVFLRLGAVVV